jgi:hypothetical protein
MKRLSKTGAEMFASKLPAVGSVPGSKGLSIARKMASGDEISIREAVLAHCAMCLGWYADGLNDCNSQVCPLYPWMPYGEYRKKKV